mgnify:FL=1
MSWLQQMITRFLNAEPHHPDRITPLSDVSALIREAQRGDVILVEGQSRVSDVIRWVTLSPWTHAALYIGTINELPGSKLQEEIQKFYEGSLDEPLVIESFLGQGTIVQPVSVYEKKHLRLARPKGLKRVDALRVTEYAVSRLGALYDVRQIFDLLRFLFPWFIVPRRWRSSLFHRNSGPNTRTVCSTMIAEAFGRAQFPILPLVVRLEDGTSRFYRRNPKLCTPSHFDYSPYFEIIKYPLTSEAVSMGYEQITWRSASELTPEQQGLYVDLDFEASIHDVEQPL